MGRKMNRLLGEGIKKRLGEWVLGKEVGRRMGEEVSLRIGNKRVEGWVMKWVAEWDRSRSKNG